MAKGKDTLTPLLKRMNATIGKKLYRPVVRDISEAVKLENIRNIAKRKKPDGTAQKRNKQSTINAKGHDLPLWGKTGILKNPSLYTTIFTSNTSARIFPPPARWNVIGYLDDMNYGYWAIPAKIQGKSPRSFYAWVFLNHWNKFKKSHG